MSFWNLVQDTKTRTDCGNRYLPHTYYVEDLQLRAVILHKKVQEDPSIPLKKPQEDIEDPRREVGPTSKRQKIIK
jgi:hypothetical protein